MDWFSVAVGFIIGVVAMVVLDFVTNYLNKRKERPKEQTQDLNNKEGLENTEAVEKNEAQ